MEILFKDVLFSALVAEPICAILVEDIKEHFCEIISNLAQLTHSNSSGDISMKLS